MTYKIISINPGVDEFRYYNTKEDAENDRDLIFCETKIGSKGANCAVMLSRLSASSEYFTVGRGDYSCDSYLSDENIRIIRTVTSAGERINRKYIYPDGDICGMIEKNGKMGVISDDEKSRFFDSILHSASVTAPDDETFIFTGSLATNVENSEYLGCISSLVNEKRFVVLDGRGSLISAQTENFATLIKPNLEEFLEIAANVDILKSFQRPVEKSLDFYTDYLSASLKYVEKYGSTVLLTLGEAGLIYASADEHHIKKAVPVKLRYPAGAGDRLLSSFLYYIRSEGASVSDALDEAMRRAIE